ncbi:uncharacterized protein [Palaemon carinicauda]|uniref:uncharacterized protein n=1 Tax=Palaemon carinicauda TaxID=392227 RepID=UPI0035B68839
MRRTSQQSNDRHFWTVTENEERVQVYVNLDVSSDKITRSHIRQEHQYQVSYSENHSDEFVENPTSGYLSSHRVRKDDWLEIVRHYKFDEDIKRSWRKSQIKSNVISKLVDDGVLSEEAFDLCDEGSSILEENGISVRIVRDTGSSHSLVVRDAVPGIENFMTQDSVILRSIGGLTTVPRAKLHVDCNLFTGNTVVGVVDSLPIPNIDFLLGNYIAGSRVIPDPVVVDNPLIENPVKDLEEKAMFQSCVVEHSLKNLDTTKNSICTDAADADDAAGDVVEEKLSSDRRQEFHNLFEMKQFDIRDAQANDDSLQQIFNEAVSESEIATEATCYYLKTGILMRKYRALSTPANASWDVKYQLVVPLGLREEIIWIAHVNTSAHLGVKKTILYILQYFYWPGIREDVKKFCKVCDTCQKVGIPNQPIKPVPLSPQIVCSVLFEKVILDCVGPLPKSKKQNQYLMTVMCSSIRYPDAIPMRNISAKTLIPHLVNIFTQYGIPRIVQTDQGTNFTSTLFQEVMKVMGIKHSMSTVYHPQSQGCLERFHQTLKEGLTKFCEETGKDWEEGLPFVLYADSMKKNFDSKAEKREFKVGDRVSMLTPMKNTFESRYEGPFTVLSKNQNLYEISTPAICGDIPTQTSLVEVEIQLKIGSVPVRSAPYRVSPYKKTIMKNIFLKVTINFHYTWDSHLETLRKVFALLKAANLTLNLAKSDFGYARIQYLRYVVGSGEVSPVNAKVNAILKVKEPTCRKEVQRFLGMVGYYTRFLDASEIGSGAVLLQRSKDSLLHPVMYSSQKFKPHQRNYSTIEKEAHSLLLALEKFDTYLHSSPYTIILIINRSRSCRE